MNAAAEAIRTEGEVRMSTLATRKVAIDDQQRLVELEKVVDRGLQTFIEVGEALKEIRDLKLYRETHRTFDAYTTDRWGWNRQTATDYINAAAVGANVRRAVHLPSARHAMALRALSPDEQIIVAPLVATLTSDQAREVVRRYRANGVALAEVRKLVEQIMAADLYLKLSAAVRDILGVALVSASEVVNSVDAEELLTTRQSIQNARDFLDAILGEIK